MGEADRWILEDTTRSLEERWPIFERAWNRTKFNGYGLVTRMAMEEFYGEERMLQSARQRCHDNLEDVIDGVFADLSDFMKGSQLDDDATLLLLRRCPDTAGSDGSSKDTFVGDPVS